jgi:signal transduction histidine kinase
MTVLTTVAVRREHDVVLARKRARQVAERLGFERQDQSRVATAVSELARNAFEYAGGGTIEYALDGAAAELRIRVADEGPGIADLDSVLSGRYRSPGGMGLGILGARRLMDRFEIESTAGRGTTVVVGKRLPAGRLPSRGELATLTQTLAGSPHEEPLGELQLQNQELMRTLHELETRQEELARLNEELEETNRGVVALYAELDERANELRDASEAKSRFLSSVSHELRTPLSSMLALCDLMLNRTDGPLTQEQERQVRYVRGAADGLITLVNDLLDLARIEAGKTAVQPSTFAVADLFGSLRGMFRPLHRDRRVTLVFEEVDDLPPLHTDETKLAQVLRNFVSNALKFTEQGDVRVSATVAADRGLASFAVADTGVGIADEDRERIFEEFVQVDGGPSPSARGTGLGLAVSRRLAELLGGEVTVESEPGAGSTFTVTIPIVYAGGADADGHPEPEGLAWVERTADLAGARVLVIDDDDTARYVARRTLSARGCRVDEASDGVAGLRALRDELPDAIVLDLKMPQTDGFAVLQVLRADAAMAAVPVVVFTAMRLTDDERELVDEFADACLDKHGAGGEELCAAVARVVAARAGSGAAQ